MATVERALATSPDEIWRVLADGRRYADWVVGAKHVRSVESGWPKVGSRFHHSVGFGPLHINDSTVVLGMEAGRRLVLEARVRPLGRARVEVTLVPTSEGSIVVMSETPCSPLPVRLCGVFFEPLIHVRNLEALRRLESTVLESVG